MITKICNKCNKEKEINCFWYRKDNNAYRNTCICCKKEEYRKRYYSHRKNTAKCIKCKEERELNCFDIKICSGKYKRVCIMCCEQKQIKNKEYNRQYYENNKEYLVGVHQEYYNTHKEKMISYSKEYAQCHRKDINECKAERYINDINYRISEILRHRINFSIKYGKKAGSAVRDLGCSVEFLKQYLEDKFYSNPETWQSMTWENYGYYGWHIDHIIPLSSFDLTDRDQFLKACHYTNLQPLWAKENLSKGAKVIEQ